MANYKADSVREKTIPSARASSSWAKRLDNPKITVWTVVGFIAFLGLLSAIAAGVGYVTHSLGHPRSPKSAGTPPYISSSVAPAQITPVIMKVTTV